MKDKPVLPKKFHATHRAVFSDGSWYRFMLTASGAAYSHPEWIHRVANRHYTGLRFIDGGWKYRGKPFTGKVVAI